MSLLIWLPLNNGTLKNQGLADATITNGGATVNADGKLGSCYAFDGTQNIVITSTEVQNSIINSSSPFSLACWVYLNSDESDRAILFSSYNAQPFISWELTADGKQRLAAGRSSNFPNAISTSVVPFTTWTHLAVTYDGIQVKMYTNGELTDALSVTNTIDDVLGGNTFRIGGDTRTGATRLKGRMQDVRFYNHVLTSREVKLISRGLVAHWTLSGPGENIALNTATPLTTAASSNGSVYTGYYYLSVPVGSFTTEDVLTISFDFEVTGNSATDADVYPQLNNTAPSGVVVYPLTGKSPERGRFTFTFSPTQAQVDYSYVRVRFRLRNASDGAVLKVTNLKLEYSDHATPWSPAPADPEYSTMGYDDGIEYDVSGFGNNGVKSGTLSYSSDTPKYTTSTVFDGNSAIQCPKDFEVEYMDQITFSCWANCDWSDGKIHNFISSQHSGGLLLYQYSTGFFRARTYRYTSTDYSKKGYWQADYTPDEPLSSGWHMFTGVHDSNSIKLYIDGELMKTTEGANYGIHFHPTANMYIGAEAEIAAFNTPVEGKLSDVRIYATALTAEDVADLYHTSASLTRSGTLLTNEITEA